MKNCFQERQQSVFAQVSTNYSAFLITDLTNVHYLTGFSGSSGAVLLQKQGATFFTDFRYQQQSAEEVAGSAEIKIYKTSMLESLVELLKKKRVKKLAVESSLSIEHWESIKLGMRKAELGFVKGCTEKIRKIKDRQEMVLVRRAFAIADRAFAQLLKFIKPGKTELEIAARLEFLMRNLGSQGPSFATILASGSRAACPHAAPTEKKVCTGEMIKIDFGAIYGGYHSDMTRTLFLGKASKKFKTIYNIVLTAQAKAISSLKAGVACKKVDSVARDFIADKGFGENFGHGLGHSLGLDIHESPSLSQKCEENVEPGTLFTVEPGIYIPEWGGIRIEDVFLVQENGLERLTHTPNELKEI